MARDRGRLRCACAARGKSPFRRGMGGHRLRVRQGAHARRQELRRSRELWPPRRRPLGKRDGRRPFLQGGDRPRRERPAAKRRRQVRRVAASRCVDLEGRTHRADQSRRRSRRERHGARGGRSQDAALEARRRWCRRRSHRRGRHVVGLQRGKQERDAEVRGDLVAGDARDPRARVRLSGRCGAASDAHDPRPRRGCRLPVSRRAASGHLDLGDELRPDVRPGARDRLRALRRDAVPPRVLRLEPVAGGGRSGDDGHGRQGRPVLGPDRPHLAVGRDAGPEPGLPLREPRNNALRPLRAGGDAHAVAGGAGEARAAGRPLVAEVGALGRPPISPVCGMGRAAVGPPCDLRCRCHRHPAGARAAGHAAEDRDAVDQGGPDRRRVSTGLSADPVGLWPGRAGRIGDRRARGRCGGRRLGRRGATAASRG